MECVDTLRRQHSDAFAITSIPSDLLIIVRPVLKTARVVGVARAA
jgi:hypothetical protein